jgi:hypothetical protein
MPSPLSWYALSNTMADIAAASQVRFVVPDDGFLRRVECSIAGAIATADAVLTVSHNNTALTPTITVAFTASAEGDYDFAEYARPVKRGDWIEVASDGGPSATVIAAINVILST